MRTNDNNFLETIIGIFTSIDLNKSKSFINKSDETALLDYINKEFLNLKEYRALIKDITLEKKDIIEILYQLLKLVYTSTDKDNNNSSVSERLIIDANNKGFTWPNSKSCFKKIEEEFLELKNAVKQNDENNIKEEIGDLLFTLHCYANINKFNFEKILNNANTKFEKRFNKLLEIAKSKNIDFLKCSSEMKEKLWKEAKKSL